MVSSRGESRRVAKFIPESNTFHIKSKAIKILSCKNLASPQDSALSFFDLIPHLNIIPHRPDILLYNDIILSPAVIEKLYCKILYKLFHNPL